MYSDGQSPFDVALSRPFLDEPTRKKWCAASKPSSWFSSSNTSTDTMNEYEDIDIESVSFGSEADHDNESNPLIPAGSRTTTTTTTRTGLNPFDSIDDEIIMTNGGASGTASMRSKTAIHHPLVITDDDLEQARMSAMDHEGVSLIEAVHQETLDIDLAILREREAELGGIAGSMRQLRDIQQDLALAVDSQDDDIKRLSWDSIEAFHHTESGLDHLVATVKHRQDRKSYLHSVCASAAVVMGVCYVVANFFSSDGADAAMPSADDAAGSPSFLTPSYFP